MKIKVITSFSEGGYEEYASRCMTTFYMNWPDEIKLHCYTSPNIPKHVFNKKVVFENITALQDLNKFVEKYKRNPAHNGFINEKYQMKYDAIKFAHKVYSLIDGATKHDADIVFWLDADTVTHTPIPLDYIQNLIPQNCYTAYLGREHLKRRAMYSECGFVGYRTSGEWEETHKMFMKMWKELYDRGFIFKLEEWHDSWIYDYLRKEFDVPGHSWSIGLPDSQHPFIQKFGCYMDHLKGQRKTRGKSYPHELLVRTDSEYWT